MSVQLFYILFALLLPLLSNGQQRWEVVFGNPNVGEYPAEITNSYDGGILICGDNAMQEGFVVKTNKNGALLWQKVFKYVNFVAIDEDANGNIAVVGAVMANSFVMLLNSCGEVLWCKELINEQNYFQNNFRGVILEDSSILVLGYFVEMDYNNIIKLLKFDYEGNLVWINEFLNPNQDPLLDKFFSPYPLQKVENNFFISGICYYAYPDNPNLVYLRSMFLMVDSLYHKKWFLPYGMADTIFGISRGVIKLDSVKYRGYGSYTVKPTDTVNSIFMDFDIGGNEIGHKGIPNNSIAPGIEKNDMMDLTIINDSTYLITAHVGPITSWISPMGEWTMDSSGAIFNYQNHPGYITCLSPTVKTSDNQYMFLGNTESPNEDIVLYKLDEDLSQVTIDTNTYTYDSLCPDPIVSDTIYLDNCDIITGLEEIQTPEDYYKTISKILLTAYPNPANTTICFRLRNPKYHSGLYLRVHDINGMQLFSVEISESQKEVTMNITELPCGIYAAVVSNANNVLGKTLFIKKE